MFSDWKLWFKNKLNPNEWGVETVILWARYLTIKGITKRQFDMAKTLSIELDFPPNNAKEFLDLLKNDEFKQFPQARTAYFDAVNHRYTHEVVYETANRVGFWELKTYSEKQSYPLWQHHYPQVCQAYLDGERFAIPQERQIEYHREIASDEFVQQMFDKIRKNLVGL